MDLKSLMVDSKSAWVDFPGLPGFEVEVVNLSRKELTKLRKRCTTQKFDRTTHKAMETLDEEKFVEEFTKATVKSWKGLKLSYLEDLILVDLEGQDLDSELAFDLANAENLVSNSTSFDSWLNEVVFDLDNFRGKRKEGNVEKT
jgi:U3 small nucleolar ribonucleoprotein component